MNVNQQTSDLIVVGGGIVGLSSAWAAARRGYRVAVLERGRAAGEASWAAAGMLSPLGEASAGGPMLRVGVASLSMYSEWIRRIEDRSGMPIDYRRAGKIQVAMAAGEVEPLRSLVGIGESAGMATSWLESADLHELEPSVTTDALGALYMEGDGAVDNRSLGNALAEVCRAEGVEIHQGVAVTGIVEDGGAATGVRTAEGGHLSAGAVLVAAGAWSGELEGLPRALPVTPVRGQMLALRPGSPPSRRILGHGHVYVVPRADGRVLVGATMEEAGFEKEITHDGIAELREGALELVPSLAAARTVERWAGLRPGSRDGLPIIGPDPDVRHLYYATGHYRNGILLAPATGRIVADLLELGVSPMLEPAFLPDRFPDRPSAHPPVTPRASTDLR